MKVQVFQTLTYTNCQFVIDKSYPNRFSLITNSDSVITLKTLDDIILLKPDGQKTVLIYDNIARYNENLEKK